jgi:hypothetical protein
MNICFVANFSKTFLFEAIALELEKHGHSVFWITTNNKLYNHLSRSFDTKKILLINRKNAAMPEEALGDFKLNELIYGDRVLRHSPSEGLLFLRHIQKPVFQFIKQNTIRKIFGELTWAHEILIRRICQEFLSLQCQFLNPHVVRIPDNRFCFFEDESQRKILRIQSPDHNSYEIIKAKAPAYLAVNAKILSKGVSLKGRLDRLKRFFTNENMEQDDVTLLVNTAKRIQKSIKEEWNRERYKSVKTSFFESNTERPYVFVGLHKQPEASVDVLGRYYEDQLQNIKNLWRALPEGWDLLVKEHKIAIGDRPVSFYKAIQSLPNVYLINENTVSYPIIAKAQLVATVSGTIAYEASLMDIPAITFAPCFFNDLNKCEHITLDTLAKYNLKQIANKLVSKKNNVEEFSRFIYENSFYGNIIDPVSDPRVMEPENIKLIVAAYLKILPATEKSNASNLPQITAATSN